MVNMCYVVRQRISTSKVVRVASTHANGYLFEAGQQSDITRYDSHFAEAVEEAQAKLIDKIGNFLHKEERKRGIDLPYKANIKMVAGMASKHRFGTFLEAVVVYKVPNKKAKKR